MTFEEWREKWTGPFEPVEPQIWYGGWQAGLEVGRHARDEEVKALQARIERVRALDETKGEKE
jgi:hypothetical protein